MPLAASLAVAGEKRETKSIVRERCQAVSQSTWELNVLLCERRGIDRYGDEGLLREGDGDRTNYLRVS